MPSALFAAGALVATAAAALAQVVAASLLAAVALVLGFWAVNRWRFRHIPGA